MKKAAVVGIVLWLAFLYWIQPDCIYRMPTGVSCNVKYPFTYEGANGFMFDECTDWLAYFNPQSYDKECQK